MLRNFFRKQGLGLMRAPKKEYVEVLEEKNIRLGKLLDISEAQKRKLKEQNTELREKIAELMKNSA